MKKLVFSMMVLSSFVCINATDDSNKPLTLDQFEKAVFFLDSLVTEVNFLQRIHDILMPPKPSSNRVPKPSSNRVLEQKMQGRKFSRPQTITRQQTITGKEFNNIINGANDGINRFNTLSHELNPSFQYLETLAMYGTNDTITLGDYTQFIKSIIDITLGAKNITGNILKNRCH